MCSSDLHCAARLAGARAALVGLSAEAGELPLDIDDVAYPGFEGRPRARDLEGFIDVVSDHVASRPEPAMAYATGIGGMVALCLRARGLLARTPLLLQAPVLWGLERRLMPRFLRFAPARLALLRAFECRRFQRRFARRHFMETRTAAQLSSFFDGYARCAAAPDLFAWFGPALLRRLETALARAPLALAAISVWWGGRDRVLTPRELGWTETALGVRWPLRVFPAWGHYPMLDDPEGWLRALLASLVEAADVRLSP